jgi:hypothetical protein
MLQLENQTPFKAALALFPDRTGIDTLYVAIKATLTLSPQLVLAPEQVPVIVADEYYGEPATSSLKATTEMHIGKTGTDVLFVGQAWAADSRPVSGMYVTLAVAGRRTDLLVTGDRVFQSNGTPSEPEPFVSMPLVWERAFGGVHRQGDRVYAEERNPVGCGFAGKRGSTEMKQQPVPNLENPRAPLQKLGDVGTPLCFAPVAPSWLPRRSFAGTYDAQWRRSRAPYLPDDFDRRFFNSSALFSFEQGLKGGEPVQLSGVTPGAPIAFNVPASPLQLEVRVAGSTQRPPVHLETILIEPDANRVCMTWRAAQPCDRQALKIEKASITLTGPWP